MYQNYETQAVQIRLDELIDSNWLEDYAHDLTEVPSRVVNEIIKFIFLWMFFEMKALNKRANFVSIDKVSKEWAECRLIDDNTFCFALDHFRKRYVEGDSTNGSFDDLYQVNQQGGLCHCRFGKGTPYRRVQDVLLCNYNIPEKKQEKAAAVLFILYRLRNNLLHGNKFSQLKYQLGNFRCANDLLKCAIELLNGKDLTTG